MEKGQNPYHKVQEGMEDINNRDFENAAAPPYSALQQEPVMQSSPMHITVGNNMGFAQAANYNPPVGPQSTELSCPQCRCRIKTKVRHRSTSKTHIACLLLTWTLCCCCLPYCMDSCRNANHFCPMCGAFIGTYQS